MVHRLPVLDVVSGSGKRVATLPHRYAVSPQGTYAHIPRSASLHTIGGREWLSVVTLCGMSLSSPVLTDDPPPPHCASCFGRSVGVHPITGQFYAFRPEGVHAMPPKWCPGPRRGLTAVSKNGQVGRCQFCGFTGRMMARRGWNAWGADLQRHEHLGCGVACPQHGWRHLDGVDAICRHWGNGQRECGLRARPFWILTPIPDPEPEPPADFTDFEQRFLGGGAAPLPDIVIRRKR